MSVRHFVCRHFVCSTFCLFDVMSVDILSVDILSVDILSYNRATSGHQSRKFSSMYHWHKSDMNTNLPWIRGSVSRPAIDWYFKPIIVYLAIHVANCQSRLWRQLKLQRSSQPIRARGCGVWFHEVFVFLFVKMKAFWLVGTIWGFVLRWIEYQRLFIGSSILKCCFVSIHECL